MKQSIVRGIKIDATKKTVEQVAVVNSLEGMYKCIECEWIERVNRVTPLLNGNNLWVDEEGAINGTKTAFTLVGYPGVLHGNGLILGDDGNGNTIGFTETITLEQVKEMVMFYNAEFYNADSE